VAAVAAFSRRHAGRPVGQVCPMLKGLGLSFAEATPGALAGCDALFYAVPATRLGPTLRALSRAGAAGRVIDLGSDFRIKDLAVYQRLHGRPHPYPELLERFVQVVPEINGEQCRGAGWVALPGCVSTAALLGLYPLVRDGLLANPFVNVDAKVGSTGAGNSRPGPGQLHYLRTNGVRVHRLLARHRHGRELAEYCRHELGRPVTFHVNTFSVDMDRGIACAAYFEAAPQLTANALYKLYRSTYAGATGVRVVRQQSGTDRYPNPRYLTGTNLCDIGFEIDPESGRGVIVTAIDNLIRGGAGQAVQVFNLQRGLDRDLGLVAQPRFP
jgi:N-acetyl-gamma-glutamyl-phosphate/LysW-gamma-L-alpha-aminoadipyl-6-phosphate reductase